MEKKLCCMCSCELLASQKRYCSRKCYFKKKEKRKLDREEALKLSSAAFLHDNLTAPEPEEGITLAYLTWGVAKMVFLAVFLSMLIFISIALNSVLFYFVVAAVVGYLLCNI